MDNRFGLPKIQPDLIRRQNLSKLYEKALNQYKVCYISGVIGCGKTHSVINWIIQYNLLEKYEVVYINLTSSKQNLNTLEDGFNSVHKDRKTIIIVDQFQTLQKEDREAFVSLIKKSGELVCVFILSRTIMPLLFVESFCSSELMIIDMEQLFLSRHEVIEYLKKKNLVGKRHFAEELSKDILWIPIMLEMITYYHVDIFQMTDKMRQELRIKLLDYMDKDFFEHYKKELRKVMIEIAPLPYVTEDLVELLSDYPDIKEEVRGFSEQTYFVQCLKRGDIYQNQIFQYYTKYMFRRYVSNERKEEIFRIAGNYYSLMHRFHEAVTCYMKVQDYDQVAKMCFDYLWDEERIVSYKELFLICCKLPQGAIKNYKELYFLLAMGYGFMYQFDYAKDCYEEIVKEITEQSDKEQKNRHIEPMLHILEFCIAFLPDQVVINRFMKLEESEPIKWTMERIINSVENLLCLLRISGRWNLYSTEFSELHYEKVAKIFGKNYYELLKLYRGCMLLRKREIKEAALYLKEAAISCRINNLVGGYLLAKIYLILMYIQNGDMGSVKKIYEDTEEYIIEKQLRFETSNWEEVRIYIALYEDDNEVIDDWWKKNKQGIIDEITIYTYTKHLLIAKIAILKQDYFKAFSILDILLEHTKRFKQTVEEIQVVTLYSVLCFYVGNKESALLYFEEAYTRSKQYGFIEFIAEYGVVAIKLLDLYQGTGKEKDLFFQKVYEASVRWAQLYPNYLIQSTVKKIHFTEAERKMLQELASDKTNQEIADELCITLNTVKHHTKNIYAKLGVNNRRKAVATAKEYGFSL